MRDKATLDTRTFLDAQTENVKVISVFHSPRNGLTTELELVADLTGKTVETTAVFRHFGYVKEDQLPKLGGLYAVLMVLIAISYWLNIHALYHARKAYLGHRNILSKSALTRCLPSSQLSCSPSANQHGF